MLLTRFLKRVLVLDAASCLTMGALLVTAAGTLSPLFGLMRPLVFGAGVALIPAGLFILWLGTRRAASPWLVYVVVVGNLLWTLESILLIRGADTITALGTAFVAIQAAAVAGLAALEWVGVRRARQQKAAA